MSSIRTAGPVPLTLIDATSKAKGSSRLAWSTFSSDVLTT